MATTGAAHKAAASAWTPRASSPRRCATGRWSAGDAGRGDAGQGDAARHHGGGGSAGRRPAVGSRPARWSTSCRCPSPSESRCQAFPLLLPYIGVYAGNHRRRVSLTPGGRSRPVPKKRRGSTRPERERRTWADLMRRAFALDEQVSMPRQGLACAVGRCWLVATASDSELLVPLWWPTRGHRADRAATRHHTHPHPPGPANRPGERPPGPASAGTPRPVGNVWRSRPGFMRAAAHPRQRPGPRPLGVRRSNASMPAGLAWAAEETECGRASGRCAIDAAGMTGGRRGFQPGAQLGRRGPKWAAGMPSPIPPVDTRHC